MANFPTLSSGAISQYPLVTGSVQNTSVIRFLDGADQRFLSQGRQFRRWQIKLGLLNDAEMDQLEAFFDSQQGAYAPFTFTDPITGLDVPNCRIGVSELITLYQGVDAGSTSLWVMETNA
ncbi:MAG: hypothetical protein JWP08_153 [Bryobacterales bacterium]|jgi:uncharacterized protein DUF2460|nr:hypothetical protein [Bryobacterales bacterium]